MKRFHYIGIILLSKRDSKRIAKIFPGMTNAALACAIPWLRPYFITCFSFLLKANYTFCLQSSILLSLYCYCHSVILYCQTMSGHGHLLTALLYCFSKDSIVEYLRKKEEQKSMKPSAVVWKFRRDPAKGWNETS